MSEQTTSNVPTFKRDANGLVEGVEYQFNPDGTVNWRKMVKPEFLAVNKEYFERVGKPTPASVEGLEDKELIILLGGLKDLARLRGYTQVKHKPYACTPDYVQVVTTINWIGNYETNGQPVEFDALADASPLNCNELTKYYLSSMAENRGFVRAVRNFLGINIVGQEELGRKTKKEDHTASNGNVYKYLVELMDKNDINFEKLRNAMLQEKVEGAQNWVDLNSIESSQVLSIIEIVKRRLKAREEAAKKKPQA